MLQKLVIIASLISIFSVTSFAEALPKSVYNVCKASAFEQMVEWLKGKEFYNITNVETQEGALPGGQQALFLKIYFNDSKGCNDRRMIADCVPLDEKLVLVQTAITDCQDNPILHSGRIKY